MKGKSFFHFGVHWSLFEEAASVARFVENNYTKMGKYSK
jgi:hypothetical protein